MSPRLLFPLGAALAWLGVLPWLFFGLQLQTLYAPFQRMLGYRAFLHPIVELDGFFGCFAAGLLFTAWRADAWETAVALAAPIASALLGVYGRWEEAQLAALLQLAVMVEFCARRMRRAAGFLWIALGLAAGLAGAVLGVFAKQHTFTELARDLSLQATFMMGAAGTARLLRADPREQIRASFGADVVCAVAFLASFVVGGQPGSALRAAALVAVAWPWRVPYFGPEHLRRSFAHLALLLLALGNAWVAIDPPVRRAGLHLVFLGAFSTLLFAAYEKTRWIALAAALFALATFGRIFVELDAESFHGWMTLSSASFLAATALCAVLATRARAS